jgi:hypothetical protein
MPVQAKKKPIKKILRWVLVVFFLLSLLGSIDDSDAVTAISSVAAVVFFAWAPLKWLSDKRGSKLMGTAPGSTARYTQALSLTPTTISTESRMLSLRIVSSSRFR